MARSSSNGNKIKSLTLHTSPPPPVTPFPNKVYPHYDPTQTKEGVDGCYCQKLSIKDMYDETFFFQTKAELSALAKDRYGTTRRLLACMCTAVAECRSNPIVHLPERTLYDWCALSYVSCGSLACKRRVT